MPLFEIFRDAGGIWVLILIALAWIAYSRLSATPDEAMRWVEALSQPWLMKTAVGLALLAWIWNFVRLYRGYAYLRGSDTFAELSTVLLGIILVLAGVAWLGVRSGTRFRPWITYGLVLILIVSSGALLLEAPEKVLSQGSEDPRTITFIQGRLVSLGCFKAAGEPDQTDGSFDALTASAATSFQLANGFAEDDRLDRPGVIRPRKEFRLLAQPFPFLLGPKHCPASGR